jgi:hypothetical protein
MATAADRASLREASRARLNALDLYDVRASLTDEERMVQDSVARLVATGSRRHQKHFGFTFPRDRARSRRARPARQFADRYGCAGMNAVSTD